MTKKDLKEADFQQIASLGAGASGTVHKCLHKPSGIIMAKKNIPLTTNETERTQIIRELTLLQKCNHPNIVNFYGAFFESHIISICLEYMDLGSLDNIYPKFGTLPEEFLGKVAVSVLDGLDYLYSVHKVVHRDMKPSNLLLNSSGQVKICDLGVSGVIMNTCGEKSTFVGTSLYMSPSRIQGLPYSVQSDSWSLGISLVEMAIGKPPFASQTTPNPKSKKIGIFDCINLIVKGTLETLPRDKFSADFCDFTDICMIKEDAKRPSPSELLKHKFIVKSRESKFSTSEWIMNNRHILDK